MIHKEKRESCLTQIEHKQSKSNFYLQLNVLVMFGAFDIYKNTSCYASNQFFFCCKLEGDVHLIIVY